MMETKQRSLSVAHRDWSRDLARAEQRGRVMATEHPLLALGLALFGGYCLGRAMSRV
jgi:hypothetical protein